MYTNKCTKRVLISFSCSHRLNGTEIKRNIHIIKILYFIIILSMLLFGFTCNAPDVNCLICTYFIIEDISSCVSSYTIYVYTYLRIFPRTRLYV